MAGVAFLAEKMGYNVTGCDIEGSTAYAKNIFKGHDKKHLEGQDLLIISPAIKYQNSRNPEYLEGLKRGIVMTWEEFLGKVLLKDKKVVAVAGTHGKSTTTAMIGKILVDAGLDPIVVAGATVPEWKGSSRFGKGEWAVVEADEFNNNFLNYYPNIAIINNIEFDHPDFFQNEQEVKESFEKFTGNLTGEKILITEKDSQHKVFNLKIMGEHNQKNANMAYLVGKKLKIDEEKIIKSIESFVGLQRRMQLISDSGGIKLFDDYAHHPTAIKTTLEGVRKEFPEAKILVIDEPHGYKRTKALLSEYRGIFDAADKAVIGPIFQARDKVDSSITPQKVADASNHINISAFSDFEDLFKNLELEIRNCNYGVIVVMGAGKSYLWAQEISKILGKDHDVKAAKDIYFKDLTTFRTGGKIENYIEIENEDEICKALAFADSQNLPIFILGGGSDILVSDKEFKGVVIKYTKQGFDLKGEKLSAFAGTLWDDLVGYAVENGLKGLETLSGIPGTVGAAPIQNIGAYGAELADHFFKLRAYDLKERKFVEFSKNECKFGYRESIFKSKGYWQRFLITEVTFSLNKNTKAKVAYESLKGVVDENASIKEIRDAVLRLRAGKLEDPKEHGNAGSFFKNPVISPAQKDKLIKDFPGAKVFPYENGFKVSAAWLIENAELKGRELGAASVSAKHSLIIINKTGNATAEEIYDLSELVISEVYKKFGVKLEREVQIINF